MKLILAMSNALLALTTRQAILRVFLVTMDLFRQVQDNILVKVVSKAPSATLIAMFARIALLEPSLLLLKPDARLVVQGSILSPERVVAYSVFQAHFRTAARLLHVPIVLWDFMLHRMVRLCALNAYGECMLLYHKRQHVCFAKKAIIRVRWVARLVMLVLLVFFKAQQGRVSAINASRADTVTLRPGLSAKYAKLVNFSPVLVSRIARFAALVNFKIKLKERRAEIARLGSIHLCLQVLSVCYANPEKRSRKWLKLLVKIAHLVSLRLP